MLVILYQDECISTAEDAAREITAAFGDAIEVLLVAAATASFWPKPPDWDDLLIILYENDQFPDTGNGFIAKFIADRQTQAVILPVALNPNHRRPPEAASLIKALQYQAPDPEDHGGLVRRVGAMLGLRTLGRGNQIFISYRATDGSEIAEQLFDYLSDVGHQPWRDEARELDGEPKILPGSPVQAEIDDALGKASLMLLLDTPSATTSPWIRHEVDTADALLLPILPICFRESGDRRQGPRFSSLVGLQRWVSLPMPSHTTHAPLRSDELATIVQEAETYLCEIFQRKRRVPFIVKGEFVSRGFAWNELDKRLLMFQASRHQGVRLSTKVLSHCSIFEQVYPPAIERFRDFLERAGGHSNYSLFIYDGELLSDFELQSLIRSSDDPVIVLHHQELATLIDSNFTTLGT